MRLKLILIILVLIGTASAEIEYVKVNGFNVSFDLNQTHDTTVDIEDSINGSMKIRAFDGSMTCNLFRYPKTLSVNSTWVQESLIALSNAGIPAEKIEVDNNQGIFIISMSNDTGEPIYGVIYYPDIQTGKANIFVSLTSTLPFYTTADLLRTIHVVA